MAALICAARDLIELGFREQIKRSQLKLDDMQFHRFLRLRLTADKTEKLLAIFVDGAHGIICDEIISDGGQGALRFRASAIVRRAFELDAAAVVLAHNHPSMTARPSDEDIAETRRFRNVAASVGIGLLDHIIVTRAATFSMRKANLLCV